MANKLYREFYERDNVVKIAKELLGKRLVVSTFGERKVGRITETEAYNGRTDRACHAYKKNTSRTEIMYRRGGHSYVYLIYGIHELFNVVTNKPGFADAVLIRAVEPIEGIRFMLESRGFEQLISRLTAGPGNLTKAFGINRDHNGLDLLSNTIWIEDAPQLPDDQIVKTTRINVDYAGNDAKLPWRFYDSASDFVSKR